MTTSLCIRYSQWTRGKSNNIAPRVITQIILLPTGQQTGQSPKILQQKQTLLLTCIRKLHKLTLEWIEARILSRDSHLITLQTKRLVTFPHSCKPKFKINNPEEVHVAQLICNRYTQLMTRLLNKQKFRPQSMQTSKIKTSRFRSCRTQRKILKCDLRAELNNKRHK